MSEFSCVSHFFHLCFFLLSHPLYFSYFIFFFPYLLKLLSFLSPLFITTFLLVSAFVTLLAFSSSDRQSMGLLATTYQIVFDGLRPRTAEEIEEFRPLEEELEAYKIVFETYTFGIGTETEENPYGGGGGEVPEVEVRVDCEEPAVNFREEIKIVQQLGQEREKENEEKDDKKEISEDLSNQLTEDSSMIKDLRKQVTDQDSSISSRSEWSPWSSPGSLGSYGSMRKEKEWRRTLACKLFEERHNAEGSEGMDSLWETYEKSESAKKLQKNEKQKQKQKQKQKREKKFEEEEEEEEEEVGQLCCLQALKLSAGKMNLGMGRPNLVKMSKAFKGFGWLNRHGGSRKALIH